MYLALNNLQGLICHKTQQTETIKGMLGKTVKIKPAFFFPTSFHFVYFQLVLSTCTYLRRIKDYEYSYYTANLWTTESRYASPFTNNCNLLIKRKHSYPSKFYAYYYDVIIIIYHLHHHVVLVARISLTLSRHFSLSFIASGRSSGQHPVSSYSCWMYVRAGRPAFARSFVGVHNNTIYMFCRLYKLEKFFLIH